MRLINADEHECWACIHHQNDTGRCDTWCDAGESFELREDVKNAKTVEARPVVYGEWLDTQPDYHPGCGNNAHVCSICGDYYTTEPEDLFFCPRCGADMRKKVQG